MSEMNASPRRPGAFIHLVVMFYDTLLLLSVLLVAGFIAVAINRGEAINPHNPFFFAYLVTISALFYGWFWTHGGQTLGMRAWKVHIISSTQQYLGWKQAINRFFAAIVCWLLLGIGYWWPWLTKQPLSWVDRLSGTQLVVLKK